MHKLGHLREDQWVEYSYPPTYQLPHSGTQLQRILVGIPGGDPEVFARLVAGLEPPYYLLYILHTSRGEGEPGRYQSPKLSLQEFQSFISQFGGFLSKDARFDIWAHSPSEQATVVWDRHNQIFAYGPLARFESELCALGFLPGTVTTPGPHEHCYHAELDPIAAQLLQNFEWSYSPLMPEDVQ